MWLDLQSFTLIANQSLTYYSAKSSVFIAISPQLTKIFYSLYDSNGSQLAFIKAIDFETATITDINFVDLSLFAAIANIWNNKFAKSNLYFGDRFIAIRNDSKASNINRNFVEQGYYFNGSSLVLIGERQLS